ncbi:SOS response-associated peptidase [Aliifodinibius sp. S!AR15-10]|uniref:SOS response-associated peptidase n=1 Tax=Aliifodinibius sp. S!AR15-10 TaxID=2950437 RepID=UPI002867AC61|nr:SOS response-associated peptidase [Aliifodinibius sp. S!AR15-10]MDR8394336.1 SOS response-associated peptidase [Aliifodinibius sp. S!AR15-10]
MSDRFVLHASKENVEEIFGVQTKRDDYFEPNYNIAPGTRVPVIYFEDGERKIYDFQWGMIPEGADEEKEGLSTLNIPVESLDDDLFADSFELRRCLVPANGFYKWKFSEKQSTPFYIRLLSNKVMGLAALYTVWQSKSGRDVYSFALINTVANALVQPVDDRMPVIIRRDDYSEWLGEEDIDLTPDSDILKPLELTEMAVNRVTEDVNDTDNNRPELIQPIPK